MFNIDASVGADWIVVVLLSTTLCCLGMIAAGLISAKYPEESLTLNREIEAKVAQNYAKRLPPEKASIYLQCVESCDGDAVKAVDLYYKKQDSSSL